MKKVNSLNFFQFKILIFMNLIEMIIIYLFKRGNISESRKRTIKRRIAKSLVISYKTKIFGESFYL